MKEEALFKSRFEKNKNTVFRLCLGYFNQNVALAEDALQETFIKAWTHRNQFREDSSWETWIYRIAVNTCLLSIKKEKKEKDRVLELAEGTLWEQDHDSESKFEQMHYCIQRLKPDHRLVILMVLEGIAYSTIETTLGLTSENLRVRIHRIKKQLQSCISHGKS